MDLPAFLKRVLPENGGYIVLASKSGDRLRHEAFTSIEDAASRAIAIGQDRDVWFAVGTMANRIFTDEKGRKRSIRNQENLHALQVLFTDIDCGQGKSYPTQQDALKDLGRFLRAIGLPPPTFIVSSGYGIHLYWVLSRPLTRPEWQPLADSLKRAAETHGFGLDPAVTGDAARILRPIGTFNFKGGDKRPVNLLKDTGLILDVDKARSVLVKQHLFTSVTGGAVNNDDLKVKYTGQQGPVLATRIFERCPYLGWVRETEGKDPHEPEWMAVLHLLSYCDDGRDHIHDVSRAYITYTPNQAEQKFTQRFQVDRNKFKPTLCDTFHTHQMTRGKSFCDTCPHKGNIKSPIALGIERDVTMPPGWRFENDYLERWVADEEAPTGGSWFQVLPYKLKDFRLIEPKIEDPETAVDERLNPTFEPRVEFTAIASDGTTKRVALPVTRLSTLQKLNETLAVQYIFANQGTIKLFGEFMAGFLQTLQKQNTRQVISLQQGWQDYEGQQAFGLGSSLFIKGNEMSGAVKLSSSLRTAYTKKGELEPWQEVAQALVEQQSQHAAAAFAVSFAAPLISLVGGKGYLLSCFSDGTGTGKTTVLRACQAIWGDPSTAMQSVNDTENAVADSLARIANIPLIWDELRTKRNEDMFVKFVFSMFEGREKRRMTTRLDVVGGRNWQTMLLCGTNTSIRDIMKRNHTGGPGMARAFEIEFPKIQDPLTIGGKEYTGVRLSQKLDSVRNNYGHAGRLYIAALLRNLPHMEPFISLFATKWREGLADVDVNERFHIELSGLAMAAAILATKFGILRFDLPRLSAYFRQQLQAGLEDRHETEQVTTIEAYLEDFVQQAGADTLITDHIHTGRGLPHSMTVISASRSGRIHVQKERDGDTIVIDRRAFLAFLAEHRANATTLTRQLKTKSYFKEEARKVLGAGTEYKTTQIWVYVLEQPFLDNPTASS